ncbi:MAG: maleylpyruvate isomerase N-terminal domain-containing protein [Actinobacteria bacterium]|nr:maleylpyruvate isomerase N-terminal domain-containing protein [Actinomycetota bacterium]
MNDTRTTYLQTAAIAVNLLSRRELGDRWTQPSVLTELEVGELAAHLARAILQVEWFLDMPEPDPPVITAAEYFRPMVDSGDSSAQVNVGIRERARTTAAGGWARLYLDASRVQDRLGERLQETPPERRVLAFAGRALLVDEYLKTRLVEMTIHIDDLARSLDVPAPALPEHATAVAIAVLVDTARARHGDRAILHALARRERDETNALRVL